MRGFNSLFNFMFFKWKWNLSKWLIGNRGGRLRGARRIEVAFLLCREGALDYIDEMR